jgi:hypothetical protein
MTSTLDIGSVESRLFDSSEQSLAAAKESEGGRRPRRDKYPNGVEEGHWAFNRQAPKDVERRHREADPHS